MRFAASKGALAPCVAVHGVIRSLFFNPSRFFGRIAAPLIPENLNPLIGTVS
jgi:hypothetical protein